jgi:polar amino acid transport system substrate-binding protein
LSLNEVNFLMKNISIKIIVYIFLLINYQAFGSDKIVSVVTLVDYAPYVFVEGNKSVTGVVNPQDRTALVDGYSWEVFKESFHVMGYSIKYTVVPWARALKYLKSGQADLLFPISKSKERLRIFNYSKEPINKVNVIIYFPITSSFEWKGYNSIKEKIIGAKRAFNYGHKWDVLNCFTKYDIGKISTGFKMLEKGHLDGFIGYQSAWDYFLKQKGWENKFQKTPVIDSTIEYVVTLNGAINNDSLLDVFDQGKRKLIASGRLIELQRKWFDMK